MSFNFLFKKVGSSSYDENATTQTNLICHQNNLISLHLKQKVMTIRYIKKQAK